MHVGVGVYLCCLHVVLHVASVLCVECCVVEVFLLTLPLVLLNKMFRLFCLFPISTI